MKLIIEIPDKMYEEVKSGIWLENNIISNAIDKGTPLEESEDCVSRQAVLDLPKNTERGFGGKIVEQRINIEYIKALPSVTPAENPSKWIPVSERLPEIHQDILLSLRSLDVEVGFMAETEPYFYCHGAYIEPQNVLAWMPLPEPYKAESEDMPVGLLNQSLEDVIDCS